MPKRNPASTLFGRRLRQARLEADIPQDKLGVMIGLDESSSSARISRYETGVHEPSLTIASKIAEALHTPTAYFFCEDDTLAEIIRKVGSMSPTEQKEWLSKIG